MFDPHYEVSTVFNSPCAISNFNKLNNDFSDKSIVTKKRGMPRTLESLDFVFLISYYLKIESVFINRTAERAIENI